MSIPEEALLYSCDRLLTKPGMALHPGRYSNEFYPWRYSWLQHRFEAVVILDGRSVVIELVV